MVEIAERNFDKEMLECGSPVLACFTTEWCHSCYPMCLFANQLVKECDGRIKFIGLDTEKNPEIAERYHVVTVPTILLFQESREVKRLLGFQDRSSLRKLLISVTDGNETK